MKPSGMEWMGDVPEHLARRNAAKWLFENDRATGIARDLPMLSEVRERRVILRDGTVTLREEIVDYPSFTESI